MDISEPRHIKTPVELFDDDQKFKGGKTAREYYQEIFADKPAPAEVKKIGISKP